MKTKDELIRENEELKSVLKSILEHIESDLISLDSSGYLKNDIKNILDKSN
jgi:hypothetical protein